MPKPPLEKNTENGVARWALQREIRHRKLDGMGHRDWPDQLFLIPAKIALSNRATAAFIEFKRLGNVPTPNQQARLDDLASIGFDAKWCDNRIDAVKFLQSLIKPEYR